MKLKSEWDEVYFSTTPYKDSKVNVLTALDDILAMLEEQITKVQGMRGSAFVKPIAEDVKEFYALLIRMQNTLEEWTKVVKTVSKMNKVLVNQITRFTRRFKSSGCTCFQFSRAKT